MASWSGGLTVIALWTGCALSSEGALFEEEPPPNGGGAATAASSGAGTGAGGAAASGTGAGAGEECGNGEDDDADGAVDCDDSDCSDHVCVDAVPGAIHAFVAPGAGCPAGWTETTLWDCQACACAAPCTVEVALFADHLCSIPAVTVQLAPDGTCVDHPDALAADTSVTKVGLIATFVAGAQTCAPTAGPAAWSLCMAEETGSCAGGKRCLPPGNPSACVLADAAECPAGYDESQLLRVGDEASCGCTCGGAASCPSEIRHYRDSDACMAYSQDRNVDGACVDTYDGIVRSMQVKAEGNAGCAVSRAPSSGARALCCQR